MLQGAAELDPQDVDMNKKKALALGNALLVCMAVPWAVCVIVYSGEAFSYVCGTSMIFSWPSTWPMMLLVL